MKQKQMQNPERVDYKVIFGFAPEKKSQLSALTAMLGQRRQISFFCILSSCAWQKNRRKYFVRLKANTRDSHEPPADLHRAILCPLFRYPNLKLLALPQLPPWESENFLISKKSMFCGCTIFTLPWNDTEWHVFNISKWQLSHIFPIYWSFHKA